MNIKIVAIEHIKPYEKNPRKNDAAVDKVAASIKEFGFKQPIVVDKNGIIIVGHARYKAAKKLGMTEVPVLYAEELTEEQVKAYRLADNKTGEFAEWDLELLADELKALEYTNFDMKPFGFVEENKEVVEDDFDVDATIPEIPITKKGDIWLLGSHRLMCGDSTTQADVDRLMDGKLGSMVFTDPPYNINYEGRTKDKLKILNDAMSDSQFYQFLYDSYICMYNAVGSGSPIYVCHSDSESVNFRKAMKDSGWELKQCIIWVKNSFILGRQDHQWAHEPILYGWKPGGKHKWYGDRKQSTVIQAEDGVYVNNLKDGSFQLTFNNEVQKVVLKVPSYDVLLNVSDELTTTWHIEKPLRNGEHPTMKPIRLCARAILNSSLEGDIVVDLFGGSGSTLMACEQTGRICYTMELDEKYCDVIVKRWEEFTGQKATLLAGGDQICQEERRIQQL